MPSLRHWLHVALAAGLLPAAQDVRDLTPDTPIRRELSTGQVHAYRLTVARGDFVHVTIEQQGIDVAAILADADGREILAVDAMDDEFRPETVVAIADAAGSYTLTTKPASTVGGPGHYSIRLDLLRAASASDQLRIDAERAFAQGRKRRNVNQAATWPAALGDFTGARDRYRTLDDRAGEMKALIEIAVTENYMSRAEALVAAQQAERLAKEIDDLPAMARVLRVQASIYALAGDIDSAARAVEHATEINRAIGNRVAESHSVNYTALLRSRMGDMEQAIALYERALSLGRANADRALEASVLNNLAVAYSNLGEYEKARVMYEQSLANQRTASNPRGEDIILMNLGGMHLKMGRVAQARELRSRALEIARRGGDSQTEARALAAVGETYFAAGEYAEALRYYRDGLATSRQLGDVRNQGYALSAVGGALHRLGRYDEALQTLQEALTIHRQTRQRLGERDTLADLARVERDRGRLDEALQYSRESVDLDEAMREEITAPELRTTFVAAEQEKYELLIDVLQRRHRADPSSGDAEVALEVSERARARALLDSLLDARVDLREGIDPALRDRERSLQKQLNDAASDLSRRIAGKSREEAFAAAAEKVDRLTTDYQQLQAHIRRESPHYAAVTQPQPLSAREIQQSVVDEHTVLLEFALGEERSWLWAVTPDRVTSIELPSRKTLDAAARSLYERFTARQERRGEAPVDYTKRVAAADARLRPAMAEMSRMLFGGIARQLNDEWRDKRLAIVAAGALEYLPFAALPVPEHTPAIALIARHEIVTIPSASVLDRLRRETRERAPASGLLAIVADPVFDRSDPRVVSGSAHPRSSAGSRALDLGDLETLREGFSRLPFSRDEATAIASLAGPHKVFKALDFSASRATVLGGGLRRYRIVHFATHGVVDSRRPALSGLILSLFDEHGAPQNGHLRLHDIYNTQLNADLVVLSACQTALGKEIRGEGLVSLTRAFMYAGAPRVVASLWQVNDHATAELMSQFYRGILQQKLPPAAALRNAQRTLSRDPRWSAPYYWAGFVLQGDWTP